MTGRAAVDSQNQEQAHCACQGRLGPVGGAAEQGFGRPAQGQKRSDAGEKQGPFRQHDAGRHQNIVDREDRHGGPEYPERHHRGPAPGPYHEGPGEYQQQQSQGLDAGPAGLSHDLSRAVIALEMSRPEQEPEPFRDHTESIVMARSPMVR